MLQRLVWFLSSAAPVFCGGHFTCESVEDSQSTPSLNFQYSPFESESGCFRGIPWQSKNMGKKRKCTTGTRNSKWLSKKNAASSPTKGSPAKIHKIDEKSLEDQPSLASQNSQETLPYSFDDSNTDCSEKNSYNDKDFLSDDGSDDSAGAPNVVKPKETIYISDNSSDDEDETGNRPWSQAGGSRNKGKYTMRQTTLHFASAGVKNNGNASPHTNYQVSKVTRSRFKYSDEDTADYRNGYPRKIDDPDLKDNLLFYEGSIKSKPSGDFITTIHQDWFGKYRLLEEHHGYIQWLFPIREKGMNYHAQALQLHEAKAIQSSKEAKLRVLTSYRLMLDFYGMKLVDPDTGEIQRSTNWRERFENLKWSSHNYLRITRILKSLGELGYEHLKKPFLEFVLHEALVERTLERLMRSCQDYWIGTIKDDAHREILHTFIQDRKRQR